MVYLSLILFFPCFLILGGLFVLYPRSPRGGARKIFDALAILVALVLSLVAMRWGYLNADPEISAIWKQVLATLFAYGAFLAGLVPAFVLRRLLLPRAEASR